MKKVLFWLMVIVTFLPAKVEAAGWCVNVPVLMYHHVLDVTTANRFGVSKLNVTPEMFGQQMKYLKDKRYRVVSLESLAQMVGSGTPVAGKAVVLTFDDGYRDFYQNAYPVLQANNFSATLFVITQLVGGDRYVTWDQLKAMTGSGLITAGDHTLTHASLKRVTVEQQKSEIVAAKNILESRLGQSVNLFAYPYGEVSKQSYSLLVDNGFLAAVTTNSGRINCAGQLMTLNRIRIGQASLSRYGL